MNKSFKVANSYGNDVRCDSIFLFSKIFWKIIVFLLIAKKEKERLNQINEQ